MFKTICNLVVCLLLFFSSLAHAQSETGDKGGGSGEASRDNNVDNVLAMLNGNRDMMARVHASLSLVLSSGSAAGVGTSAVPVHLTPRQPLDAMSGGSAGGGTSGEPVHAMSDIYGIE